MINSPNSNIKNKNGIIMEAYDDRPISMYDNLSNLTANTNAAATPTNSHSSRMANATISLDPNSVQKLATTITSPTSAKANGAAHSTPFTDINFKINENNKTQQKQQEDQQQQLPINGNRNLNEIHPNTGNATAFATPYKTSVLKPATTTASPPLATQELLQQQQQQQLRLQQQQQSPLIATTITLTATTAANTLTSSPSLLHSNATTPETATVNLETFNSINRPLSQHSESALNDTSHSIAAVKAALNEAKSKFFGLNGCTTSQQQQQLHYDDTNYIEETLKHPLLPSATQPNIHQVQTHQQQQQVQKPQPKYQNIPENSAIYRKQLAEGAGSPPDLPPKPIHYQNSQQPSMRSIRTSTPDQIRQMPVTPNTYNQISLNDIDGATSRSQTVYMATTVPQNIKGNKIAGRHTPTRSSLRHSRMLVVNNKNYQEVKHPNPMGFQQPTLARWLLILQIIIGILLLSISVWIFFLTPNIPVQDNPYWCGSMLLLTGIVGLIVVRYPRFKRAKAREHCFMFLRMDSYVLSLLSVLLCCVALIFAAIHYSRLTAADTKCKSMHLLVEHGSCVCTFNAPPTVANATEPSLNESLTDEDERTQLPDNSYKVEYRDLSCQEVTGPWTSILGLSFILNSLGFLISFVYIVLLACCRRPTKNTYNTVRTSTF